MNGDWVNIADCLPPHGVDVLVCNDSGGDRRIASLCDAGWVFDNDSVASSHIMYWHALPDDPLPSGPFYHAVYPSGSVMLYKRGDYSCAALGEMCGDMADGLVNWLNRLWREK